MKRKSGFTLAEVLITLAIIGVVAALTVPSVVVRTNQSEFKSSFKKAVSVLNQAITLNIAMSNKLPADTTDVADFSNYLQQRMNVVQTNIASAAGNNGFLTADGFKYMPLSSSTTLGTGDTGLGTVAAGGCGDPAGGVNSVDSAGEQKNDACYVVVDVNGDRAPNSGTAAFKFAANRGDNTRFLDVFPIMVTDVGAKPYGAVAQRAMFQAE